MDKETNLPLSRGIKQKFERHLKGWGWEDWLDNRFEYCGKILHFEQNKKCSFHYHKIKKESFYILKGKILLKYSDSDSIKEAKEIVLEQGDCFHIYQGLRHQMFALEESDIIEISTKHYEDDSIRIVKGD